MFDRISIFFIEALPFELPQGTIVFCHSVEERNPF